MKSIILLISLFFTLNSMGQMANRIDKLDVNDLTAKKLAVESTTHASKPCPKMTQAQRDAIVSPLEGQCVYNSTSKTLNVYDGVAWVEASGGAGGIANWETGELYEVDDVVIYNDEIYQAIEEHTSGGTFDEDKFKILSQDLEFAKGILKMSKGGTEKNLSPIAGGVVYTDSDSMEILGAGTSGQLLKSNGESAPSWVDVTIGEGSFEGILPLSKGGTEKALVAEEGAIAYSDADSLELLSPGTDNQVLKTKGAGLAPEWGDVALSETTGILPLSRGGTEKALTADNGAIAYSDADSLELLPPGTPGQFLKSNGAAAPGWEDVAISADTFEGVLPLSKGGTGANQAGSIGSIAVGTTNSMVLSPSVRGKYLRGVGTGKLLRWHDPLGNFIGANDDFESNDVVGYVTYKDAASEKPVDGTGGTPSLTFGPTTFSPRLGGINTGLITKGSSNLQGEGVSYNFTIDPVDQAKVLKVSFDYSTSAAYQDADMRVYIYDPSNEKLYEVIDRDIVASESGTFVGTVQLDVSPVYNYRLIFHVASTNAAAYTVRLDNVYVGRDKSFSTASREVFLEAYSVSGQSIPNATNTIVKYETITSDTNNAYNPTTGEYTVPESGLYHISASLIFTASSGWNMGEDGRINLYVNNTLKQQNRYELSTSDSSAALLYLNPGPISHSMFLNKGDIVDIRAYQNRDFPTPLFNSSGYNTLSIAKISSDSSQEIVGNREIVGTVFNNTAQNIASSSSYTVLTFSPANVTTDTVGAFSDIDNGFIIPETGFYDLFTKVTYAGTSGSHRYIRIEINGSELEGSYSGMFPSTNIAAPISTSAISVFLKKGDIVRATTRQVTGSSIAVTQKTLTIAKRSSPRVPPANEVIYVKASNSAGQSLPNSTQVTVTNWTEQSDTHNAFNPTTGVFTAPRTGYYSINFGARVFGNSNDTIGINVLILKNGSSEITTSNAGTLGSGFASRRMGMSVGGTLFLNKGDQVTLAVNQTTAGTRSLETSGNYLTIKGN